MRCNHRALCGLALLFLLSACAPGKEELMSPKPNEATVVINLHVQMDGNDEGGLTSQCWPALVGSDQKPLPFRKDKETHYYVYKVPAGKVTMQQVICMANKVFYNKSRRYDLTDMYFIAEPGAINYVGDLRAEWSSDRMKIGDLLFSGVGTMTADEGQFHIILQDRMDDAVAYMRKEYNAGDKPFVRSFFADHPLLTK